MLVLVVLDVCEEKVYLFGCCCGVLEVWFGEEPGLEDCRLNIFIPLMDYLDCFFR